MTAPAVRLLVVDDEPAIRRLLRTGLGSQGYLVAEAATAAEAERAVGGADRGRFGTACTVTDTFAEGTFQCQVTLALPDGLLTLQGLVSPVGPRSTFAVTGGTGRYRNARGSAVAVDTSPDHARLTLSLLP